MELVVELVVEVVELVELVGGGVVQEVVLLGFLGYLEQMVLKVLSGVIGLESWTAGTEVGSRTAGKLLETSLNILDCFAFTPAIGLPARFIARFGHASSRNKGW